MSHIYHQDLAKAADSFDPNQVKLFKNLKTAEHITAVIHIPEAIRESLSSFSQELSKKYGSSLWLVDPQRYHVTLGWTPVGVDTDLFLQKTEQALQQLSDFTFAGVFIHSESISIPAHPNGNELYEARKILSSATGQHLEPVTKNEIGWCSIARFKTSPPPQLIDIVKTNLLQNWGKMTITSLSVYKVSDKQLDTAVEIGRFTKNSS